MADPIKLRDEETTILDKIYKWVILDKDVQNGPGTVVDLSNYYNKQYIDNLFNNLNVNVDLSNYYTKTQVTNLLKTGYYNKVEINELLRNLDVDLSNYYNKQEIDNLLQNAGNGSLPAQYRINNQSEDYMTQELDFNGSTIIRCLKETDQVITITKPTDDITIEEMSGDFDQTMRPYCVFKVNHKWYRLYYERTERKVAELRPHITNAKIIMDTKTQRDLGRSDLVLFYINKDTQNLCFAYQSEDFGQEHIMVQKAPEKSYVQKVGLDKNDEHIIVQWR